MKNKNRKMEILRQDLVKYSKQIGIVDCEVPELVFYGEEFNEKVNPTEIKHLGRASRRGGRHTGFFGLYGKYARVILVNIRGRNKTIKELRHTMIHELVHYRFYYLSHGDEYEKRIKFILAGKEYPRHHITVPQLPYV